MLEIDFNPGFLLAANSCKVIDLALTNNHSHAFFLKAPSKLRLNIYVIDIKDGVKINEVIFNLIVLCIKLPSKGGKIDPLLHTTALYRVPGSVVIAFLIRCDYDPCLVSTLSVLVGSTNTHPSTTCITLGPPPTLS